MVQSNVPVLYPINVFLIVGNLARLDDDHTTRCGVEIWFLVKLAKQPNKPHNSF